MYESSRTQLLESHTIAMLTAGPLGHMLGHTLIDMPV